jgi:MFS family permease
MNKVSRKLTYTILSMSLLTVMAGAAIAPALGAIRDHFSAAPGIVVQLIVSIPALFIIITNLFFSTFCRFMRTKTLALTGLCLYVLTGAGCFFAHDIAVLLLLRSMLGISVGMIMPLSTGLLSYYFPPEAQAELMGLAAAMNQMGGVVATLLAGLLASLQWNYAFLVYLLGIIAIGLVACFLPNEQLTTKSSHIDPKTLLRFHPSITGMLLLMILFFIFPTNFAITAHESTNLTANQITFIMVGLDVIAFFTGLAFGRLMHTFRRSMKYFAPAGFILGYICYAYGCTTPWIIVGSCIIGIANGVGVPYLNTIASIKGGKDAAVTVMPLISASLYLGQFLSPFIVTPLSHACYGNCLQGPYKIAIFIGIIFLIQVFLTHNFQSLPPKKEWNKDFE